MDGRSYQYFEEFTEELPLDFEGADGGMDVARLLEQCPSLHSQVPVLDTGSKTVSVNHSPVTPTSASVAIRGSGSGSGTASPTGSAKRKRTAHDGPQASSAISTKRKSSGKGGAPTQGPGQSPVHIRARQVLEAAVTQAEFEFVHRSRMSQQPVNDEVVVMLNYPLTEVEKKVLQRHRLYAYYRRIGPRSMFNSRLNELLDVFGEDADIIGIIFDDLTLVSRLNPGALRLVGRADLAAHTDKLISLGAWPNKMQPIADPAMQMFRATCSIAGEQLFAPERVPFPRCPTQ